MSRPICVDSECERAVVRYRDGAGYCMFHPEAQPPVIDPKTGKFKKSTPLTAPLPRAPLPVPEPVDDMVQLQAELDELESTDPVVAQAAASYDAMVERVQTRTAAGLPATPEAIEKPTPADVDADYAASAVAVETLSPGAAAPVDTDLTVLQLARKVVQAVADDPRREHAVQAIAQIGVGALDALLAVYTVAPAAPRPPVELPRPVRRRGRPSPVVDEAEAVRRYLGGERLFDLAADLHIGAARLRTILHAHGVTIRSRGQVIGRRGRAPRGFNVDEAERLYRGGMNSAQVARQLGVKQGRVQDALRDRGVLARRANEPAPLDEARARHLYAQGMNLAQVARELGVHATRVADVLRAHGELRSKGRPRRVDVPA